ncbi:Hypothetical predicted protein [Paramuricea clavata]|uniref:Uncharacterized protein n=1 Tax=Paramuricea clavata TaxID=317549 RepID=A0A6S7L1X8_PARCT|nr:Hypothetical predicted protein [Paramuricea clavata]
MVAVYLYKRHDESKSYANVVDAHTTLKWFHTFEPYQIGNPFDIPVCRNILETSKSDKRIFLTKSPIFRPLRFFRSSNLFKLYGARLSYTRCRENKYGSGLHSLRSGEATAAANDGNVTERQLKLHGCWKTDIAKDDVHDSVKNRLLVTENLGL